MTLIDVGIEKLKFALKRADREREIKNPVVNLARYNDYVNALLKVNELFCTHTKKGKVYADHPDEPYKYHTVDIRLIEDDFEGEEVQTLTEIISAFDCLAFYGSSEGIVTIQLIVDGLYREKG